MTASASRFLICTALLLAACATRKALSAAVLIPMGNARDAHVDPKLLPRGAVFELDEEHEFVLRAGGAQNLIVITLGLNVDSPQRDYSECGLYFSAPDGTNVYVPVAGHEFTDDSCGGIHAVGLMRDAGPRPRLIVIAMSYNFHGTSYRQPFVLAWNAAAKHYEVDQSLSKWLTTQPLPDTVTHVRNLLAGYAAGKAQSATVLIPLGIASAAHVDPKILPPGTVSELDAEDDLKHEFVLRASGAQDLFVTPLSLTVQSPQREYHECGIYFSASNGIDAYVPVAGQELSGDMCDAIRAVGLMRDPGPRPRLIAIATQYNAHGTYYWQPFVLGWSAAAKHYEVDRPLSMWLAKQPQANTVAQVRKLLGSFRKNGK